MYKQYIFNFIHHINHGSKLKKNYKTSKQQSKMAITQHKHSYDHDQTNALSKSIRSLNFSSNFSRPQLVFFACVVLSNRGKYDRNRPTSGVVFYTGSTSLTEWPDSVGLCVQVYSGREWDTEVDGVAGRKCLSAPLCLSFKSTSDILCVIRLETGSMFHSTEIFCSNHID